MKSKEICIAGTKNTLECSSVAIVSIIVPHLLKEVWSCLRERNVEPALHSSNYWW